MKRSFSRYLILLGTLLALCLPGAPAFAADATTDGAPESSADADADAANGADDDADAEDEQEDLDAEDGAGDDAAMDDIEAIVEAAAADKDQALPAQDLTGETLYEFLLAEIAGARGQLRLSAQTYLELARKTRDPRVARRAAQFSAVARDTQLMTEAVQVWREIDPQSQEAQQWADTIARGSNLAFDRFQALTARALAGNPTKLAPNLMGLNRALAKADDKDTARKVVYTLTAPYLRLPEAHYARAQASALARRPMEALQTIDRALELRPDWQAALFIKAHLLIETGNADKASQLFAGILKNQPGNNGLRLTYARSLIAARQFDAARAEFRTLLAATPGDRDLIYAVGMLSVELGEISAAEPLLKKALAAGHPEADAIRIQLGKIADNRKERGAARKWYEAVGPGNRLIEARSLGAQSLMKEGRIDQARRFLHATRTTDPETRRRLLLAESQLLANAGRAREAYALIDKALGAQPDDEDLLYESAMLAERIGLHEIMEGRLRKLIALNPESAHAYNALGYSLLERSQRLDEAEALIARALELLPRDAYILDSMGWAHFRRGDLASALARLEEAYALRDDPEIAAHLGEVLWRLDRGDEARRILDAALAANPDSVPLKETVRRLYPSEKKR